MAAHVERWEYSESGFIQNYLATADIVKDEVVVVGDRIYIAAADILDTERGPLCGTGQPRLPVDSLNVPGPTDVPYWDDTAKQITSVSTSNTRAGVVVVGRYGFGINEPADTIVIDIGV